MPHIGVSSWSLHRALGRPAPYGPERSGEFGSPPATEAMFSLLELPARIAAQGYRSLDLCHFHLPACDAPYLAQLRAALAHAGVTLWSLLVDAGDINHPEDGERDAGWIARWIAHAGALGAKTVRVVAGRQAPTPAAIARSVQHLSALSAKASAAGVQLTIENWMATACSPQQVKALRDGVPGALGLKLDFGNWSGDSKYDDLTAIAPMAESCHAKAHFANAYEIDGKDYERCLAITRAAGFDGPYILIYDDPNGPDEWRGLQIEHDIVARYA